MQKLLKANPLLAFQCARFGTAAHVHHDHHSATSSADVSAALKALTGVKPADIISSKDSKWLAGVMQHHTVAEHDKHYNAEQTA